MLFLAHEVDVDKLTPEAREKSADILRKVLMGEGYRLTAMHEKADGEGGFHITLAWEKYPNPRDLVTYKPLKDRA